MPNGNLIKHQKFPNNPSIPILLTKSATYAQNAIESVNTFTETVVKSL